jgi:phytoene/squalene synthetase
MPKGMKARLSAVYGCVELDSVSDSLQRSGANAEGEEKWRASLWMVWVGMEIIVSPGM